MTSHLADQRRDRVVDDGLLPKALEMESDFGFDRIVCHIGEPVIAGERAAPRSSVEHGNRERFTGGGDETRFRGKNSD